MIKKTINILLIAVLLCGCRNMRMAHTSHVERDTVRLVNTEYVLDSVYIDRWHDILTKGDTVYIRDSVTRWRLRVDSKTDTVYKVSEAIDTFTVTKTVRETSKYLTFCAWAFPCLVFVLIVIIGAKIFVRMRKIS